MYTHMCTHMYDYLQKFATFSKGPFFIHINFSGNSEYKPKLFEENALQKVA